MTIDQLNKKFRVNLANQYKELSDILAKLTIDPSPITTAVTSLKNDNDLPLSTPTSWGYKVKNLVFRQEPISGIQYPKEGNIKSIKVVLDIDVKAEFRENKLDFNPFQLLEFNLTIEGLTKRDVKHILCFHLDRQPENSQSDEVHPAYHIHVGGHRLKSVSGENFGSSLFMGSPRLKHYPMDLILGIDFVTSNFCPGINKKLRSEQRFIKLLRHSQELILKPYYCSLSRHFGFETNVVGSWNAKDIFPQLI